MLRHPYVERTGSHHVVTGLLQALLKDVPLLRSGPGGTLGGGLHQLGGDVIPRVVDGAGRSRAGSWSSGRPVGEDLVALVLQEAAEVAQAAADVRYGVAAPRVEQIVEHLEADALRGAADPVERTSVVRAVASQLLLVEGNEGLAARHSVKGIGHFGRNQASKNAHSLDNNGIGVYYLFA